MGPIGLAKKTRLGMLSKHKSKGSLKAELEVTLFWGVYNCKKTV